MPEITRSQMDDEKLEALTASIEELGLIHPIVVRRKGDKYEVIAGTRRLLACQFAGDDEISADLRDVSDRQALEIMLAENIQRENLNPVDKGRLCKELLDKNFYSTHQELADMLGLTSKSSVTTWIKLADESTPKEIQDLVAVADDSFRIPKGKIDYKTAYYVVSRVSSTIKQKAIAKLIQKKGLSPPKVKLIIKILSQYPTMSVEEAYDEMTKLPPIFPFRAEFKKPMLQGVKVQTARTGLPKGIVKGAIVDSHFTDPRPFGLKITDIYRKKLGEFDEEDAKREGGYTLEEFKEVWERTVEKKWNPDQAVYIVRFEVVK